MRRYNIEGRHPPYTTLSLAPRALVSPSSSHTPAPAPPHEEFEALLDERTIAHWIASIDDWDASDYGFMLDQPPDSAQWPWSVLSDTVAHAEPPGLVRESCEYREPEHGADFAQAVRFVSALEGGRVEPHCEAALLAHLYAARVPAHAYVAVAGAHVSTPTPPEQEPSADTEKWNKSKSQSQSRRESKTACYACLTFARTLGEVCGDGEGFTLRNDGVGVARVVLPWVCPRVVAPAPTPLSDPSPHAPASGRNPTTRALGSPPSPSSRSSSSSSTSTSSSDTITPPSPCAANTFALALERLMADALLRALQRALVRAAEQALVREELAMLCHY